MTVSKDSKVRIGRADGIGWTMGMDRKAFVTYMQRATTACLTAEQRTHFLGENLSNAQAVWESCERKHGRVP